MGDKKEYVKLWLSYRSYFEAYSAAEVGRLVLAAMDYRESGAEPEFSGSERFIWPAIRRDIDESVAAQKAISASRSEAGKQGGRPESEKANAFDESNEKQKKQMLSEESKKSYGQRKRTKDKDKDSILLLSSESICFFCFSLLSGESFAFSDSGRPPCFPASLLDAEMAF